jgi:predicted nicotinamide N-methyase
MKAFPGALGRSDPGRALPAQITSVHGTMATKKKKQDKQTERQAYGLTVLKAADRRIRQLRRRHEPSIHGNKFWGSSWAIMDYLSQQGLPHGARVMDVGCGWGLAGIFCAHHFAARVTSVDADPEVFPYLELHAEINNVQVTPMRRKFGGLRRQELTDQDVILGADICFWDEMTLPLFQLIKRALAAGAQQIIMADPGRPPFSRLGDLCVAELGGEMKVWKAEEPVRVSASLLIVGSLPG